MPFAYAFRLSCIVFLLSSAACISSAKKGVTRGGTLPCFGRAQMQAQLCVRERGRLHVPHDSWPVCSDVFSRFDFAAQAATLSTSGACLPFVVSPFTLSVAA